MAERLTCYKSSVHCGQGACNYPRATVQAFPPNVLPQTPQNMAVDLASDGLAHGNNPANVEQTDEHALGRAADLSRLLRLWSCWALPLQPLLFGLWVVLRLWSCGALPLQRLLFGLWVVPVDPSPILNDDSRHEGWVSQMNVKQTKHSLLSNL